MNIHDLPVELWRRIFAHLPIRDKVNVAVADEYFRGAMDAPELDGAMDLRLCRGCKTAPINGLFEDHRCVDCYDGNPCILASRAMNAFKLTPEELSELKLQKAISSPRRVLDRRGLFKFKDVREAALKKHGKRMGDVFRELEAEQQLAQAVQDKRMVERTNMLRNGLAQRGLQYSEKCAHLVENFLKTGKGYDRALSRAKNHVRSEHRRAPRAAQLDARLDALGIDRSYYSEMRAKYAKNWAGYRDLERIVQIVVGTWELEREIPNATPTVKLERALALRGITLPFNPETSFHTDTRLFQKFHDGESRLSLPSMVERRFEMHLLRRHTNYDDVCYQALEHLYLFEIHNRRCMTYHCEDLANLCLAALGKQNEEAAHSAPRCSCGLSSAVVKSEAALDYVNVFDAYGPPRWMWG